MDKVIIGDQYTFIFGAPDMPDHGPTRLKHNGDQVVVLDAYGSPGLWLVRSIRTGISFDASRIELDYPDDEV